MSANTPALVTPEFLAPGRACLSVSEFRASIGISRTIAYRWLQEGKVKFFRVGKRIFIPVSELADFPARMTDRP